MLTLCNASSPLAWIDAANAVITELQKMVSKSTDDNAYLYSTSVMGAVLDAHVSSTLSPDLYYLISHLPRIAAFVCPVA